MRRQTDGEAPSDRLIRDVVCCHGPAAGRARRRSTKPIARPRLVGGTTLIRIEAGAAVEAEAVTADTAGQIEPDARQPGYPLGDPSPPPSRQAPPVHQGGETTDRQHVELDPNPHLGELDALGEDDKRDPARCAPRPWRERNDY